MAIPSHQAQRHTQVVGNVRLVAYWPLYIQKVRGRSRPLSLIKPAIILPCPTQVELIGNAGYLFMVTATRIFQEQN